MSSIRCGAQCPLPVLCSKGVPPRTGSTAVAAAAAARPPLLRAYTLLLLERRRLDGVDDVVGRCDAAIQGEFSLSLSLFHRSMGWSNPGRFARGLVDASLFSTCLCRTKERGRRRVTNCISKFCDSRPGDSETLRFRLTTCRRGGFSERKKRSSFSPHRRPLFSRPVNTAARLEIAAQSIGGQRQADNNRSGARLARCTRSTYSGRGPTHPAAATMMCNRAPDTARTTHINRIVVI